MCSASPKSSQVRPLNTVLFKQDDLYEVVTVTQMGEEEYSESSTIVTDVMTGMFILPDALVAHLYAITSMLLLKAQTLLAFSVRPHSWHLGDLSFVYGTCI
jgi:hypothetical protein